MLDAVEASYLGFRALGASSEASFALLLALFERRRSFQGSP